MIIHLLKKDSLKEYIFNTQKNYYVNKTTEFDNLTTWTVINTYPLIGLEIVNDELRNLLDQKFEQNSENPENLHNFSDSELSVNYITIKY